MSKKINFYLTSNFGGGGQTVSRLFSYLSLLDEVNDSNIHLLLNYRYLDYLDIKPNFNLEELAYLKENNLSLNDFIKYCGNKLATDKKEISNSYSYKATKFNPKILLDSGMGSILSYWINQKKYNLDEVVDKSIKLIDEHLDFIKKYKPYYFIGLDYCKKNTYKQKETEEDNYNEIIEKLIHDSEEQNNLLDITIKKIKLDSSSFSNIGLIAPIHGESFEDYLIHYKSLLKLEKKNNFQFSGFALGGLAKYKQAYKIAEIVKEIRSAGEMRIIHILGSSGIDKIPILTLAGADSFDCHSPWRRANDGDTKILMPLLDKNLKFNDKVNTNFSFKEINELNSENYYCDCPICSVFSIDKINSLYNNRNQNIEDYYFASILVYIHAIYQYHYLQEKLLELDNNADYLAFFRSIPDKKLSKKLLTQMSALV
jgi:hypothetical protein